MSVAYERILKKIFEERYSLVCVRSAGSKEQDLVLLCYSNSPALIEIKSTGKSFIYSSKFYTQITLLGENAKKSNSYAFLFVRFKRQEWKIFCVYDPKKKKLFNLRTKLNYNEGYSLEVLMKYYVDGTL